MGNIGHNLLLLSTIIVVGTGGLMALLIGLVLPNQFLYEDRSVSKSLSEYEGRYINSQSLAIHPYILERNKRRHYGEISIFSWLVSISIPVYLDDPLMKYACTGTVISTAKVLTGDDCIRAPLEEADFLRGIVRSESEYFWKGGVVHRVLNYVSSNTAGLVPPYDALYILQVDPSFSKNVKSLALYSPAITWNVVVEAGWGGNKVSLMITSHDYNVIIHINGRQYHNLFDKDESKFTSLSVFMLPNNCSNFGRKEKLYQFNINFQDHKLFDRDFDHTSLKHEFLLIAYVDILKHDPFYYEKWYKSKEDCCENLGPCQDCKNGPTVACPLEAILQSNFKTTKINGRPLVILDGSSITLIGIQMNHEYDTDSTTFIDLRYDKFLKWAGDPSSNGNGHKHPCTLKVYRKVHNYWCNEYSRNSYLYAFGLKVGPGRNISNKDCETISTKSKSENESTTRIEKQIDINIISGYKSESTVGVVNKISTKYDSPITTKNNPARTDSRSEKQTITESSSTTPVNIDTTTVTKFIPQIEGSTETARDPIKTTTMAAPIIPEKVVDSFSTTAVNIDITTITKFIPQIEGSTETAGDLIKTTTIPAAIIPEKVVDSSSTTAMNIGTTVTKYIPQIEGSTETAGDLMKTTTVAAAIIPEKVVDSSSTTAMNIGTTVTKCIPQIGGSTETTEDLIKTTTVAASIIPEKVVDSSSTTAMNIGTTITKCIPQIEGSTEIAGDLMKTTTVAAAIIPEKVVDSSTSFVGSLGGGKTDTTAETTPGIVSRTETKIIKGSKTEITSTGVDSSSTNESGLVTENNTNTEYFSRSLPKSTSDIGSNTRIEEKIDLNIISDHKSEATVGIVNMISSKHDSLNTYTENSAKITEKPYAFVSYTAREFSMHTTEESEPTTQTKSSMIIEVITKTNVNTEAMFKTGIKTGADTYTGTSSSSGLETDTVSGENYTGVDTTITIESSTTTSTKITQEPYAPVSYTASGIAACTTGERKSPNVIKSTTVIETQSSTSIQVSTETDEIAEIVFETNLTTGAYTDAIMNSGLSDATEIHTGVGFSTGFETSFTSGKTVAEIVFEIDSTTNSRSGVTSEPYASLSYSNREITVFPTEEIGSTIETKSSTKIEASTEIQFKTETETGAYTDAEIVTALTDVTDTYTGIGFSSGLERDIVSDENYTGVDTTIAIESSTTTSTKITQEPYAPVSYTASEITACTTGERESPNVTKSTTVIETQSSTSIQVSTETDEIAEIVFETNLTTGAYTDTIMNSGLSDETEMHTGVGFSTEFETSFTSGKTVAEIVFEIDSTTNSRLGVTSEPYASLSYSALEITVFSTEETGSTIETKSSTKIEASTEIQFKNETETGAYTDAEILTGPTDATEIRTEIIFSTGFETSFVRSKTNTVTETTLGIESSTRTGLEVTEESYAFVSNTACEMTVCPTEEIEAIAELKSSTCIEDIIERDLSTDVMFKNEIKSGTYPNAEIISGLTDETKVRTEIGSSTGFETSFVSIKTDIEYDTTIEIEPSIKTSSEFTKESYAFVSYTVHEMTVCTTEETEETPETKYSTSIKANTDTDVSTEKVFATGIETGSYTVAEIFSGLTDTTEMHMEIGSSSENETSFVSSKTDGVAETIIGIQYSNTTSSEVTKEPYASLSYTACEMTVCTTEKTESVAKTKSSTNIESSTERDVSTEKVSKTEIELTGLTDATSMRTEFGSSTGYETETTLGGMKSSTQTSSEIIEGSYAFVSYTAHEMTVGTTEKTESTTEIKSSSSIGETDVSTEIVLKTESNPRTYTDSEIFSGLTDTTEIHTEIRFSTENETNFVSSNTDNIAETTLGIESSSMPSSEVTNEIYVSVTYSAREINVCTIGKTESTTETKLSESIESSTELDTRPFPDSGIFSGLTDATELSSKIGSSTGFETSFVSSKIDTVQETIIDGLKSSTQTSSEIAEELYPFVSYTAHEMTASTAEETEVPVEIKSSTSTEASTETNVSTEVVFKNGIKTGAHTDAEKFSGLVDTTVMRTEIDSTTEFEMSFVSGKTDTVIETALGIESSTITSLEVTEKLYDSVSDTVRESTVCTTEETKSEAETKSSTNIGGGNESGVSTEIVFEIERETGAYTGDVIVTRLTDATKMSTEIGSSTGLEISFVSSDTDTVDDITSGIESNTKTSLETTLESNDSVSYTARKTTVCTTQGTESTLGTKSSTSIESSTGTDVSNEMIFKTEKETGAYTDPKIVIGLTDETEIRTEVGSHAGLKTSFPSSQTDMLDETSLGIESGQKTHSEVNKETYTSVSYPVREITAYSTEESESISVLSSTSVEASNETDVSSEKQFTSNIKTGAYIEAGMVSERTDMTEMRSEIGSSTIFKTTSESGETDTVFKTTLTIESSTKNSSEVTEEPFAYPSYKTRQMTFCTIEETESTAEIKSSTNIESNTETNVSTEIPFEKEIKTGGYTDTEIVTDLTVATEMRTEIGSSTGFETSCSIKKTDIVAETILGIVSSTKPSPEITREPNDSESYTTRQMSTTEETESTVEIISCTSIHTSTETGASSEIFKPEIGTGAHTDAEIVTGFTDTTDIRTETRSVNDINISSESIYHGRTSIPVPEIEIKTEINISSTITSNIGSDISSVSGNTEIAAILTFGHEITDTGYDIDQEFYENITSPTTNSSAYATEENKSSTQTSIISEIRTEMKASSDLTTDLSSSSEIMIRASEVTDRNILTDSKPTVFTNATIETEHTVTLMTNITGSTVVTSEDKITEKTIHSTEVWSNIAIKTFSVSGETMAESAMTSGIEIVSDTDFDTTEKTYSSRAGTTTETESTIEFNTNTIIETDTETNESYGIETSTELKIDNENDSRKVAENPYAADLSFGSEIESISKFSVNSEAAIAARNVSVRETSAIAETELSVTTNVTTETANAPIENVTGEAAIFSEYEVSNDVRFITEIESHSGFEISLVSGKTEITTITLRFDSSTESGEIEITENFYTEILSSIFNENSENAETEAASSITAETDYIAPSDFDTSVGTYSSGSTTCIETTTSTTKESTSPDIEAVNESDTDFKTIYNTTTESTDSTDISNETESVTVFIIAGTDVIKNESLYGANVISEIVSTTIDVSIPNSNEFTVITSETKISEEIIVTADSIGFRNNSVNHFIEKATKITSETVVDIFGSTHGSVSSTFETTDSATEEAVTITGIYDNSEINASTETEVSTAMVQSNEIKTSLGSFSGIITEAANESVMKTEFIITSGSIDVAENESILIVTEASQTIDINTKSGRSTNNDGVISLDKMFDTFQTEVSATSNSKVYIGTVRTDNQTDINEIISNNDIKSNGNAKFYSPNVTTGCNKRSDKTEPENDTDIFSNIMTEALDQTSTDSIFEKHENGSTETHSTNAFIANVSDTTTIFFDIENNTTINLSSITDTTIETTATDSNNTETKNTHEIQSTGENNGG